MGMAAGQARLLSITARLTDNELRSQTITNSKLRLADKSTEASQEYMDALNSTQLMYGAYDGNGNLSYQELTANSLLSYGELKNQYSLVNSAGQIMLNGSDIKKYEASNSLAEFLYSYGIPEVENPEYPEALKGIYGNTTTDDGSYLYEKMYDETNPSQWDDYFSAMTDSDIANLQNIVNKAPGDVTEADAQSFANAVNSWKAQVTANSLIKDYPNLGGTFGAYVNGLLDLPEVQFPDKNDPQFTDVSGNSELSEKFNLASKQCYNNCHPPYSGSGQTCYLHVLAYLLDYNGDLSGYPKNFDTTVPGYSISVDSGKITGAAINSQREEYPVGSGNYVPAKDMMKDVSEYLWDEENGCMAPVDNSDTTSYSSSVAEKLLSNYKWVDSDGDGVYEKTLKTWPERVIDTYYAVEHRNELGLQYESLLPILDEFQVDMEKALSSIFNQERYEAAVKDWQTEMAKWLKEIGDLKANYVESLENIPDKTIPDEKDARYQWYVNLYYRMGGGEENADGTKNNNNYKELDENLINNAEWLQFALEHGILTMEQASYNENGSEKYPEIGTYDWKAIIYTNASDFKSQEDEVKIAAAEVKYKNKLTEIENQDKKYDQDLKKLDTEHNALQTEYDSVKGVIDKNVERSFKAFS